MLGLNRFEVYDSGFIKKEEKKHFSNFHPMVIMKILKLLRNLRSLNQRNRLEVQYLQHIEISGEMKC